MFHDHPGELTNTEVIEMLCFVRQHRLPMLSSTLIDIYGWSRVKGFIRSGLLSGSAETRVDLTVDSRNLLAGYDEHQHQEHRADSDHYINKLSLYISIAALIVSIIALVVAIND